MTTAKKYSEMTTAERAALKALREAETVAMVQRTKTPLRPAKSEAGWHADEAANDLLMGDLDQ